MDGELFSPGSTISSLFDHPYLKTPDPFQLIYLSHPFGAPELTPSSPSDFYESSFKIMQLHTPTLARQASSMNFHCNYANEFPMKCRQPTFAHPFYPPRETYDIKTSLLTTPISSSSMCIGPSNRSHPHHQHSDYSQPSCRPYCSGEVETHSNRQSKSYLQRHVLPPPDDDSLAPPPSCVLNQKEKHPPNYCYDERTVPELKFIYETLRNVWKTPAPLAKHYRENKCRKFCCQNLPHNRNGLAKCDVRSGATVTPNTRSQLVRRYSLPEIEIRKFGVIQELDSILRFAEQLRKAKYPPPAAQFKAINVIKMVEKSSQTNPADTIPPDKFEGFTVGEPTTTYTSSRPHLARKPAIELAPGPSHLDLMCNQRDLGSNIIKKPETMPESKFIPKINETRQSKLGDCLNQSDLQEKILDNEDHKPFRASVKPYVVGNDAHLNEDEESYRATASTSVSHMKDVVATKTLISKQAKEKKLKSQGSDTFVSEMLINNLNEEMEIAELLVGSLAADQSKPNKPPTPKIEVSTVYVSPEKINEIVSKSASLEDEQQTFKQTLQLPDLCLSDSFEKIPAIAPGPSQNSQKANATQKASSESKTTDSPNASEISSISLHDTFDTPTFPKTLDSTPTDSLELDKPPATHKTDIKSKVSSRLSSKPMTFNRKSSNVAEIQPIKPTKDEQSKVKSTKTSSTSTSNQQHPAPPQSQASSQPERQIVLPQRKILNRPKVNEKENVFQALDQYKIDSRGNPNYQQKSSPSMCKLQPQRKLKCGPNQASAINSRYLRVSASSTTSRASTNFPQNDKLKKVTIFEAQSNMVTPDNDMGPKRFYQKTEIFDGEKKIDILEIVECTQSPFNVEPKTPGDFYTKFSKIPIPIKKCCQGVVQPLTLNSCERDCKCPMLNPECVANGGAKNSTDDFLHEYMLSESLDKCVAAYPSKPLKPIASCLSKKYEPISEKLGKQVDCQQNNKFFIPKKEDSIDDSAKTIKNLDDGTTTRTENFTISVPSTMTAHHGSTAGRKSSSKVRYHFMKSTPVSDHHSSPSLLHRRSKKFKHSDRSDNKLLSQRKKHHCDIVDVQPAKCNRPSHPAESLSQTQKDGLTSAGITGYKDEKINAWRIPSSDFYAPLNHPNAPNIFNCNKTFSTSHKLDKSNPCSDIKFPITQCPGTDFNAKQKFTSATKCTTDSIISTTTICEKCRQCSCYTSTTFSDRLNYSPAPSVCSVCSQPFTPMFRTPGTPISGCLDSNCSNSTIISKDCGFSSDDINCKSSKTTCLPLTMGQQRSGLTSCSRPNNCNCSAGQMVNARFPKILPNDCPPISSGNFCSFAPNSTSNICKTLDQPLDRFLTSSSSSFASSLWKTGRSHTAMPCAGINWKAMMDGKKKPEIKIEPVKLSTALDDKNKNNNSVFTVTVKGPKLQKGTDLKMELCFSNPNNENAKNSNELEDETDDVSSCSAETIHERMLPEGTSQNIFDSKKSVKNDVEHGHSDYHLHLSNMQKHHNDCSPKMNKTLSVSGNAIAPEQKPKAPTMTEKDLTGRYRKC